MKEKFFKLSDKVVKFFFSLFIILYSVGNIFFSAKINELTGNYVVFLNDFNLIKIVYFVGIFLFLIYLIKKDFFGIKDFKLLCIFLGFSFVVGMIWIFINDPIIREAGDSYNCFNAAKNIVNGDYSSLSYKSYISTYPNNIGLVTYFMLHIKIFGEYMALYSIRIVNLIFVLLGYFSLYGITKLIFKNNRMTNCILIFLMFGSMQYVFYSFMVYGNCLSYSLGLLSVYCLLLFFDENKLIYIIISIISIIISISIKENSLIILIAESIFIILYILKNKKIILVFSIIFMLVGSYIGTSGLQKFWGDKVGINYSEVKLPTICWLAYGLNYDQRNPGGYTSEFEVFHVENGYMPQYTKLQAETFINGVFNTFKENPLLIFRFYVQKFLISWADPQYDCLDGYRELNNSEFVNDVIGGNISDILFNTWNGIANIIAIGLFVLIIKKYKDIDIFGLLPAVVVIGGFLFHAFWEVKSIYLYQYFMYLLPYGAYGLTLLFDKGSRD